MLNLYLKEMIKNQENAIGTKLKIPHLIIIVNHWWKIK